MDKYDLDYCPLHCQWTLLQLALQHECLETTTLLLQHGANPNLASKGTPLPLELAERSGREELVALVQKYLESNAPQTNMDVRQIFADLDGEVTKILVGHNSVVIKGQNLLEMRNDELKMELTKTADQMKESSVQLDGITKKIQDNKDLSIDEVIKMEKDRSELQKHMAALSVQLKKLKDRYELLSVKSTVDGKVITKNVEQLLKNRFVVAGQVLLEIAIEPSRNITEKTANHAGQDGAVVTIPLKAEWVPEDWLKRNIGRRHLTIVADGVIQDGAKPNVVNRVQRGILHDCRLESFEKMHRNGVEYWNASLFVPRKPIYSIGTLWLKDAIVTYRIGDRHTPVPSPDLLQDNPQIKLDEAMKEGHVFRLDYVNDDFENCQRKVERVSQSELDNNASDTPAIPSSTLNKEVDLQPEFPLIAWDFEYPLLGRRMAKLRVSKDLDLESVFPGRQTVKGKAPEAEVKELIELIAQSASVDDGLQYQNTVSRIAEFDQLDTSVRTERVAVNRAGRTLELQLNKSLHLDIVNRLWRLEGIVAIGGQDALTDLMAIANRQLQTQFPEITYMLITRDFLFGIMEDSGTRIVTIRIPVNKSESTNTTEMNFTLTVTSSGEPKLEQVAVTNSSDDPPIETPALPKTLDKSTREMDSPQIYTAKELISNSMDLLKKQQPVTVRFKVASVRRNGVIDPDGKETQLWFLSSEEYKGGPNPEAFEVQVSMDAEKALQRSGVKDIPAHFNGQELIIVGKVSISGLELPGKDAIWFYSITLERLDQLYFVKADGNSSLPQMAISESAVGLVEKMAIESRAPAIDHRNARAVVEAYVASALARDVAKAASLAKNSPADPKRIRELPEFLNVQRLKIETVYINDPAKPTRALATSVAVKLDEVHKNPDGRRDGFMMFTLEFTDEKWFVIDIDFETESGAEKELKQFLKANPNSIGIPPQSQDLSR